MSSKQSLKKRLSKGDIQEVETTEKSLSDVLKLVDRDIQDCQVAGVSSDRRYATAYGAALNLATYVIRKTGYRVAPKAGHHMLTFEIAGEILEDEGQSFTDYFDLCRRKRNKVDYDLVDVVTDTEVVELIDMVQKFKSYLNL